MENAQYLPTISDKNVLSISPCFLLAHSFFSWNFFLTQPVYNITGPMPGTLQEGIGELPESAAKKGLRVESRNWKSFFQRLSNTLPAWPRGYQIPFCSCLEDN
jgi:hypothetical protein